KYNLVNLVILSAFLLLGIPAPKAQTTVSVDEKSQKIIDQAIEAMGGRPYLNIQTVIGKGFFSDFKDGMPQLPTRFLDYIYYPDHERTEFTSSGIKTIQTNAGDSGWMFDGAVKKISDQSEAQVEDFRRSMRTTFE